MNIFAAPFQRGKTIRHPDTRSGRASHPFAEGLDTPRPTILIIKGLRYEATVLKGDDGTQVVRLAKLAGKGEVYDVSRGSDGLVRCDCPSYEMTFAGTSSPCKHGKSVVEAGLVAPAAAVANPTPVNRVTRVMPADRSAVAQPDNVREVAPVASAPSTWSASDWRRAEYFHLQPPAGMKRPVAIKASAPAPAVVAPVELVADEGATIPATATRIRVLDGSAAGVWHRQSKRGRWVHEDDASSLDLSDTARWLAYEVADAWYVGGVVEVLTEAAPALDEVWHSAYQLARDGVEALPCVTWSDAAKLAFLDGFFWGSEQRDVDHEEDVEARTELMSS